MKKDYLVVASVEDCGDVTLEDGWFPATGKYVIPTGKILTDKQSLVLYNAVKIELCLKEEEHEKNNTWI